MMAVKVISQQDNFLNLARKENVPVTIHLINGFQLKGFVKGFDNFTVVLESMGRQQLIYKHAISTISPSKPLLKRKSEEEEAAEGAAEAVEDAKVEAPKADDDDD